MRFVNARRPVTFGIGARRDQRARGAGGDARTGPAPAGGDHDAGSGAAASRASDCAAASPPPVVVPAPLPPPPARADTGAPGPPPPATVVATRAPMAEQDEAAIRRVTASYARAIETKDIGLFRIDQTNLSREEERRLQDGFRAVPRSGRDDHPFDRSQRRRSIVTLRRRDTILAGGRDRPPNPSRLSGCPARRATG